MMTNSNILHPFPPNGCQHVSCHIAVYLLLMKIQYSHNRSRTKGEQYCVLLDSEACLPKRGSVRRKGTAEVVEEEEQRLW